jgi:hypothetical protein
MLSRDVGQHLEAEVIGCTHQRAAGAALSRWPRTQTRPQTVGDGDGEGAKGLAVSLDSGPRPPRLDGLEPLRIADAWESDTQARLARTAQPPHAPARNQASACARRAPRAQVVACLWDSTVPSSVQCDTLRFDSKAEASGHASQRYHWNPADW